jgi:hypothetical protein
VFRKPTQEGLFLPFIDLPQCENLDISDFYTVLKTIYENIKTKVKEKSKKRTEAAITQVGWSNENFLKLWNDGNNEIVLFDTHDKKNIISTESPDMVGVIKNRHLSETNIVYHIEHKSYGNSFNLTDIMKNYTLSCTLLNHYQPRRQKYWFFLNDGVHVLACLLTRHEHGFYLSYGESLNIFDEQGKISNGYQFLLGLSRYSDLPTILGYNNPSVEVVVNGNRATLEILSVLGSGRDCIALEAQYHMNEKTVKCVVKWYNQV